MARGAVLLSTILVSILSLLESTFAHYTPTWAVHVPEGKDAADAVARDHGFVNLGEVRLIIATSLFYLHSRIDVYCLTLYFILLSNIFL